MEAEARERYIQGMVVIYQGGALWTRGEKTVDRSLANDSAKTVWWFQ